MVSKEKEYKCKVCATTIKVYVELTYPPMHRCSKQGNRDLPLLEVPAS